MKDLFGRAKEIWPVFMFVIGLSLLFGVLLKTWVKYKYQREPPQVSAVANVPDTEALLSGLDIGRPIPINEPDGSVKHWIVQLDSLPPECMKAFYNPD